MAYLAAGYENIRKGDSKRLIAYAKTAILIEKTAVLW